MRIITLASILVTLPAAALAQGLYGSLDGRISGADGAPIVGAIVTVEADQGARTTFSDRAGAYFYYQLPPGPSQVTVQTPGFETLTAEIEIVADERLTKDYRLETAGD